MLFPRLLFVLVLILLLLPAGRCHATHRHRGSGSRAGGRGTDRSHRAPLGAIENGEKVPKRAAKSNHESRLRESKHKEQFISHLTGPLAFKPRCRRQFHRLYHNTRDCTVPAYYKRCARLLTQLAKSPYCAKR
ncbi:protein FAM150B [Austrofundulus limnaeus]|uniref:Protein FAM150B-like n=1 Tax=Austrofundulus limnaeus TaxID=52670 RepID=A0A2I4CIE4_AUSLI|nr:PREDICTED: protein FAM150B-like [Austrofundulus limnaeus]XP_013879767.1 PREDICTED: protein FAM150B-like [Austrofundulus limnaeus]